MPLRRLEPGEAAPGALKRRRRHRCHCEEHGSPRQRASRPERLPTVAQRSTQQQQGTAHNTSTMPVIKYKTKEEELQARVDAMAKPKFATKAEEERARQDAAIERAKRASQDDAKARKKRGAREEERRLPGVLDTDGDGKGLRPRCSRVARAEVRAVPSALLLGWI